MIDDANTPVSRRAEKNLDVRERLIAAACNMVIERPVAAQLDHIKVGEVARRAGLTTGAIYSNWESQDDFRAEVMDRLLQPHTFDNDDLLDYGIKLMREERLPIEFAASIIAWDGIVRLIDDPEFDMQVGFWSRRRDPEIARRLTVARTALIDRRTRFLSEALTAYGRRPTPPMTVRHLSTLLVSTIEGLVLTRAIAPQEVPIRAPDVDEGADIAEHVAAFKAHVGANAPSDEFDLATQGIVAMVMRLTEPVD